MSTTLEPLARAHRASRAPAGAPIGDTRELPAVLPPPLGAPAPPEFWGRGLDATHERGARLAAPRARGTRRAMAHKGPRPPAADTAAQARPLGSDLRNTNLPPEQRARAALDLARLAYDDEDIAAARGLVHLARELFPRAQDTVLEMKLLTASGSPERALELGQRALKKRRRDPELHLELGSTHQTLGNYQQGLAAAQEGLRLLGRDESHPLRNEATLLVASIHHDLSGTVSGPSFHRHIDRAIALGREVLARSPDDYDAHLLFRELGLPSFDRPERPQIDALLARGSAQYQRGEYEQARATALQLLEIEPLDGLGHNLFCVATDRLAEQAEAKPLLPPIDSPEERQRLVATLEAIAADSRKADGTPATIVDLFPQWRDLTELQRGCIAYSVLPYGKLIPQVIAFGGIYHFVEPGEHIGTAVPSVPYRQRDTDGRTWYGLRGYYDDDKLVVTGLEDVDGAARGEYNTVTHEFAHLVHGALAQERDSWSQKRVTTFDKAVEAMYDEAKAEANGQRVLDAYAETNHWEYWAQGAMAYVNVYAAEGDDESPGVLFDRNPRLFRFARDRIRSWQAFPSEAPIVLPPERGVSKKDDGAAADVWLQRVITAPAPSAAPGAGLVSQVTSTLAAERQAA